jgi:hypothetical protein
MSILLDLGWRLAMLPESVKMYLIASSLLILS